jgi:hypothetical protein
MDSETTTTKPLRVGWLSMYKNVFKAECGLTPAPADSGFAANGMQGPWLAIVRVCIDSGPESPPQLMRSVGALFDQSVIK